GTLRLVASRVIDSDCDFRLPIEPPNAVVEEMRHRHAPLVFDEMEMAKDSSVREALFDTKWSLALPLITEDRIVGIVAIGSNRSGDPFYANDIDALTTLANHAGTAFGNAVLYARVALANEYLKSIVEAIQSGVVAMDCSGSITLINPAAGRILDLPSGTIE